MGRGSTRRHSPSVLLRLECSNMRCCNSSPSSRAGNPHACDSIRFPPDPEEASFPRPGNTTSIFVAIHQCPARWSAEREGGSIHVRTMRPRGTELLGMAGPTRTACSHYLSDPARPSPIYPSYIEVVGHRTPKHILPRNVNRVLDMSNIRSVQTRARGRHFAASSRYSGELRTSTSVAAPRKQGHHICLEMMIARNRPNLVQFSQLSPTRKWATNEAHTFTSSPELNPFHSTRLVAKPRKADKDTHPWSASPLRRPCSAPHTVPALPSSSARSPAGPWAWSRVRAKARLLLVLARWFSPERRGRGGCGVWRRRDRGPEPDYDPALDVEQIEYGCLSFVGVLSCRCIQI
jgi:hypothetical protein